MFRRCKLVYANKREIAEESAVRPSDGLAHPAFVLSHLTQYSSLSSLHALIQGKSSHPSLAVSLADCIGLHHITNYN